MEPSLEMKYFDMTPECLVNKVKLMGVDFDLEKFRAELLSTRSAEEIGNRWEDESPQKISSSEDFFGAEFFWQAAIDLSRTLAPECPTKELFVHYQFQGEDHICSGNKENALRSWYLAWKVLLRLKGKNVKRIIEEDEICSSDFYFYEWSNGFLEVLEAVSSKDKSFLEMRIDFCSSFVKELPESDSKAIAKMLFSEAEVYHLMGKTDVAQAKRETLLEIFPYMKTKKFVTVTNT